MGHNSGVETVTPAGNADSGSARLAGPARPVAARPRGSWWLVTALAACAALVAGGFAVHVLDQRNAARTRYRTQVLTTVARFLAEEGHQLALPEARRSAAAFGDLAGSISADQGVNGSGTLQVSLGAGSAAPAGQVAFATTVESPYASTTVAVWNISTHGGAVRNQGACVLWSTLLGPGRAASALDLGGGAQLQPCEASWWSPGPVTGQQPRLGLAGIPRSPR